MFKHESALCSKFKGASWASTNSREQVGPPLYSREQVGPPLYSREQVGPQEEAMGWEWKRGIQ